MTATRRLTAILSADVAGCSRSMGADGERNESRSGTGTVTEATKVGLEAVAYLSGYRWALTLDPR